MIDKVNSPEGQTDAASSPGVDPAGRAGFCQECGRTLTQDTLRRVGNGVFCDPCASIRQSAQASQSSQAWQPVTSNLYPGGIPYGTVPPASSEPNPVFAGILGLIPGVGAMFNGQYAKGAMHLIVFVVLLTLADNLNWVFYWLVWGWIFYQAFDAYHTARARRDNLPLPNPFGWNDIGDRFGFNRTSPPQSAYSPPPNAQARRSAPANWAGYVPPSGPAPTPPIPPYAEAPNQNPYTAPYTAPYAPPQPPPVQPPAMTVPYNPTFTGHHVPQPILTPPVPSSTRRFPVGALWLIGLGMLFLVGNVTPEWRMSRHWMVPILLAALSFWMALRRWDSWRNTSSVSGIPSSLASSMTAPVMLLTVAFLLALQAARLSSLHHTWPVLLVVWGALLLIQRSAAAWQPSSTNIVEMPAPAPPPVRSTSGTGSLGL